MRTVLRSALLALTITSTAAFAQSANPSFHGDIHQLEANVLATLNVARAQPNVYVETLMTYRGYFKANLVVIPGQTIDVQTQEGTVPVDEAVDFLSTHPTLETLQPSETLRLAAADHVAEQSRTGKTGHFGADGSGPSDRTLKHGGGKQVAEVIAYGAVDAEDVIRQLIIDDGVSDRGHRILMFADHLRYAGVACGPHPEFGTMCVIDMGDTPDAKPGGPVRRVQVAAMDETKPKQ
ncbi:CAP domain-containing protein [Sphingomonas bacterium]|uniref:CAP domain-containing protein n=1 Tax=Sphingomonas bacterium TaxID=1895847 RepID=UPI001577189A|nr:CAP domain-containing protein [Sphingomonas bacterium]